MNKTVTKQDIITRIEKDLKDKPFESLKSEYRGVLIDPIYTKEETVDKILKIVKHDNQWGVAQQYFLSKATENNHQILEDLNSGVDTVILNFSHCQQWKETDLEYLFDKIEIKHICLHLRNVPITLQDVFVSFFKKHAIPYKGSVDGFKIDGFSFPVIVVSESSPFSSIINQLNQALEQKNNPCIDWMMGMNYLGEIASLRAIRYLWQQMLGYYKLPLQIQILTHVSADEQERDINSNMIRNTTKAMSAAIGGADFISIDPHEGIMNGNQNSYRIARNIQLIMQEESAIHKIPDAAAGSYFIESLTAALAKSAWDNYRSV